MANEFVGKLDEVGIGLETTPGTPVAATDWLDQGELEFVPRVGTDFHPGNFGTIDAAQKGGITQLLTDATITSSPTDKKFGHILKALFGTAYHAVRFPVSSIVGTFSEGETVTESTSSATGTLRRNDQGAGTPALYIVPASGTFTGGQTLTGGTSGATATGGTIISPSTGRHHVFRRKNDNTPPAFTLYKHNPVEDVRASYCILESLEFEAMADKFINYSAKFVGKMFASTSAQTPTYGTENFFFGKNAAFKMEAAFNSLDAGTAVAVRRVKLSFNKNTEVYQAVGSTDATSLHNGPFDVEGEIELLYNATTQRTLVTGGTEQAMRLAVANTGATAVSGSTYPTIQFDFGTVFFTGFSQPSPAGELVKQTLTFKALRDTSRGFPAEGMLVNTRITTY